VKIHSLTRPWLLLISVILFSLIPLRSAAAEIPVEGVIAQYGDSTINLANGWGGANACHVGDDIAICFDSEAEMDAWLANTGRSTARGANGASCSSSLRLYDGTSYTGASLNLTTRLHWLNLSSYGFDQRTSSYKVGPCDTRFNDFGAGGGALYPLYLTNAYDQATSMLSGWNNRVSSVWIY